MSQESLLAAFENLRDGLAVMWSWDPHFQAPLATIRGESEAQVRARITSALPRVWTALDLSSAPESVQTLAAAKGGMRAGQALFCSAPEGDSVAYLLWWPWAGGTKISIRVGITNGGTEGEMWPRIRAVFGTG